MPNLFSLPRHAVCAAFGALALSSFNTWAGTVTFNTAGAGSWSVPEGVTSVDIVAVGGSGGGSADNDHGVAQNAIGGNGAYIEVSDVSVTPGATLHYFVGGGGGGGGGTNNAGLGGAGGGSTQLGADPDDPWLIAGGGGGGGNGSYQTNQAGPGGDACPADRTGGAGGDGVSLGSFGGSGGLGGAGGTGGIGDGGSGSGGQGGGTIFIPDNGGVGTGWGEGAFGPTDPGGGGGGGGYGGGGASSAGGGGGAGGSRWPGMTATTDNSPNCVPASGRGGALGQAGADGFLIITWVDPVSTPEATPVPALGGRTGTFVLVVLMLGVIALRNTLTLSRS